MIDFMRVSTRTVKQGVVEVFPTFLIKRSSDLMIRGGDFYAVWVEELGLWSTDEQYVLDMVDKELGEYAADYAKSYPMMSISVKYMWDSRSGSIDAWHKYCQKQSRDNYHALDEKIIFSNDKVKKEDYATKTLSYPLMRGKHPGYDLIMSTLYTPEERHKIEWAIGSIVNGDSKWIQKFIVFYGSAGTGKSTVINIIQKLFDGYYSVFDAKALGSSSNMFALESFKTNPLVAIQHDGDLSRIEDNTRLNSLVSHEEMTVNEKFKSAYTNRFNAFLIMGTNKPVKITDSKSGLLRRLIDIQPSGNLLKKEDYERAVSAVDFELGAIAYHCLEVYEDDPNYYANYVPTMMMDATNDFYNFMLDHYTTFKDEDGTSLKIAWSMYKEYVDEANVQYPYSRRVFKEELKNYFYEYTENLDGPPDARNRYYGFIEDRFKKDMKHPVLEKKTDEWIDLKEQDSLLDDIAKEWPAQYAVVSKSGGKSEIPGISWDRCRSILENLDTSKVHYLYFPEGHKNHIVVDFDIKDKDGNKSLELNLAEANKWPKTYCEVSKGGAGLHLHYIYDGDPEELSAVYDDNIEIKVFKGNMSLRRRLSKCNDLPIAHINSGLPLREKRNNMLDMNVCLNEKAIRTIIKKSLNKEYHSSTRCNIDFIYKTLNDAYESGIAYDVSDMKSAVFAFAAQSTNQSLYCMRKVKEMQFKSEEASVSIDDNNKEKPLIFFDVEVFPNLFLVNWKIAGKDKIVNRLINPTPKQIETLITAGRLVGFNIRRYDVHMLYACLIGYNNEEIYELSQKIINGTSTRNVFFREAYSLVYADVYDFASAPHKMSLKKWEIKLGIHHQELGLPWDQPVPEEKWQQVAEYCDNDVISTEAVWEHLQSDWAARKILADLAEMPPSTPTNTLTTKIIFGNNREPQSEFNYRNLAEPVYELEPETRAFLEETFPEMMAEPHGKAKSLLPYFEGYEFECGKSTYKGIEPGEGGEVFAVPGMYGHVALLDVASMHPHSTMAEVLFGVRYTKAYRDIVYGRVNIKHEAWDAVDQMLDGKLRPAIDQVKAGIITSDDLANALKTAINSVYGLTAAGFMNPFKDIRNIDNIVAKRGALFMIDLKYEVEAKGFTVAHIKTDSIKIPDATPEIIDFVMKFGKRYGYTFEHEATYEKMCLVNNAVYIAKYLDPVKCEELYGYAPKDNKKHWAKGDVWTATGKQFAVPYVYKTLFSKEPIEISDMCETFSVKSSLYLDMNEKLPDVTMLEKDLEKLETKYKKGQLSDTTFESEVQRLNDEIATGHDYRFVGRVGEFCPVMPGYGGGILCREQKGKFYAATGTTGFRWLESEIMKVKGNTDFIDRDYYRKLVDDAKDAISEYGDFEWFVSDDPYIPTEQPFMKIPIGVEDEVPFY